MKEKLTQKDVEKIQQEIDHRKLVVRKEAIEAVKEARAQGDLSENFEYYAAKKHKNQKLFILILLPWNWQQNFWKMESQLQTSY